MEERTLERWMALEMGALQRGLAKVPRPLADLLAEAEPTVPGGAGPIRLDRDALVRLAERLTPLTRARLRVPITFRLDREAPGNVYVLDAAAQEALREAGYAVGAVRDGRLWLGESLAREAARAFPTLFQFMIL